MELGTWLAFFAASWAISLSPGAGAVAAMGAGLNHGFARGYWLSLGLVLGIWTQIAIVGLGLGALILTSSMGFSLVKWLGVAYLVWLGIQQWRTHGAPVATPSGDTRRASRRSLVARGWMVNSINPKGTVFLLAVVPHFLDLSHHLAPQYGWIALTLGFTDLVVMGGYTALASRVLRLLRSPRQMGWLNKTFGGLFIAAGLLLAGLKRHNP